MKWVQKSCTHFFRNRRGVNMGREKKQKKKTDWLSNLILIVAIGVFLYAGFQLFQIFREYKAGEDEYKAIEQMAVTEELVPVVSEKDGLPEQKKVFNVDFAKLKKINPDVVGWIRFEEPSQISYPLVKGTDNEKYLKTTFEGNRNSAGTLFLDMNNAGDFSDYNTFIYGHNMKNGSMFGRLRKYKSKSFCEKNPYFYIYTPDGMEVKYQVFAASVVKDSSDSYRKWYADDADFEQYLKYIKGTSLYNVKVEVNSSSKIVSLSTCTNVSDDERLLVHGVKVSETPMKTGE